MKRQFPNPWWDRRNETSPRFFEVDSRPIASHDVIDFYEYQGTVLGVVNRSRVGGKGEDDVITQCVTLRGAMRHLFGSDDGVWVLQEPTSKGGTPE